MTKVIKEKRIELSPMFKRKFAQASPEIKTAFIETFELFLEEPYADTLRNHLLTDDYAGIRSIDVTNDW